MSYVRGMKCLGYSFYVMKGKCQLTVHPKSKAKMKSKLKELTSRSNGWGYAKRKQKLKEYIQGWVGYYHLANMKRLLLDTDEWLRRRYACVYGRLGRKSEQKWQTSSDVVSINTKHTNGVILARVIGE